MTDIVKRLNDRAVCSIAQNSCRNDARMLEAANEIERLREALREIVASDWKNGVCADIARAALGEVE